MSVERKLQPEPFTTGVLAGAEELTPRYGNTARKETTRMFVPKH